MDAPHISSMKVQLIVNWWLIFIWIGWTDNYKLNVIAFEAIW